MSAAWAMIGILLAAASPDAARPLPPGVADDIGWQPQLGQRLPLELPLTAETGRTLSLGDCLEHKPAILVLTTYRCASLCTLVHNGLIQALHALPATPGREFNVVMVSFDPRETYPLAATKKDGYLARYGRREAAGGWHCLTGDARAIAALCQVVGFRFHFDARHQDFIHTAGLVFVTPDGRIARYVHDIFYPAGEVQQALADAQAGRIPSGLAGPWRYCFHYDPESGRHTALILALTRVLAGLTLVGMAILAVVVLRHTPRSHTTQAPGLSAAGREAPPAVPHLGGKP